MKDEIKPIVPVSREGLDEIAEALLKGNPQQEVSDVSNITPARGIQNQESYIILPGRADKSYPDLLVSMHRLSLDAEVQKTASSLGLNLANTVLMKNGHAYDYIGNINWENAKKLAEGLGGFMLPVRAYEDLIDLLRSGKVHNGKGTRLPEEKTREILDEILGKRNPWRSEWFGAKFSDSSGRMQMTYRKGDAMLEVTEDLDYTIKNDCFVDLEFNEQGMPLRKSQTQDYRPEKNVYHWYPRNGAVAGFWADSDRADLNCIRLPTDAGDALGVRPAKLYKK